MIDIWYYSTEIHITYSFKIKLYFIFLNIFFERFVDLVVVDVMVESGYFKLASIAEIRLFILSTYFHVTGPFNCKWDNHLQLNFSTSSYRETLTTALKMYNMLWFYIHTTTICLKFVLLFKWICLLYNMPLNVVLLRLNFQLLTSKKYFNNYQFKIDILSDLHVKSVMGKSAGGSV